MEINTETQEPTKTTECRGEASDSLSDLLSADVQICEGVESMWRYHLCHKNDETGTKSLCGARTMSSGAPLDTWGLKPEHIPSTYCADCEGIALGR